MHRTRPFVVASFAFGLSTAALIGLGGPAVGAATVASAASSPGTTCTTANATATIKPGLTFSTGKDTEAASLDVSGCAPVGTPPTTTLTATIKLKSTTLTCASGSGKGTFKATAGNGQTASGKLTLTAVGPNSPLQFTITGTVTKGLLAGSSISGEGTATPVDGDCADSPLTKATLANNGNFTL